MEYMELGSNSNMVVLVALVQNNVSDVSHVTPLSKNYTVQHTTCRLYKDSGSVYIKHFYTPTRIHDIKSQNTTASF
jgi:hypothetical protein